MVMAKQAIQPTGSLLSPRESTPDRRGIYYKNLLPVNRCGTALALRD